MVLERLGGEVAGAQLTPGRDGMCVLPPFPLPLILARSLSHTTFLLIPPFALSPSLPPSLS